MRVFLWFFEEFFGNLSNCNFFVHKQQEMAETRSFENQLEEYETQLRNTIEKGGKPSVDLCVKIIKLINDTPLRRPDLIVKCGREILFESKVSLGDSGM